MITITDSFRDFDNLEDYVNCKINLVGNKRYNVFASSPEKYFERVKAGGYATDPNYVNKMNQMLTSVRSRA
jgi:flagellum-specific peptidoglycan hydrolase FlgJ